MTQEIHDEINAVTERRLELWRTLATEHDPERAAEIERLNDRIRELWDEARAARTRAHFGSTEAIIARARAEERLERELNEAA